MGFWGVSDPSALSVVFHAIQCVGQIRALLHCCSCVNI